METTLEELSLLKGDWKRRIANSWVPEQLPHFQASPDGTAPLHTYQQCHYFIRCFETPPNKQSILYYTGFPLPTMSGTRHADHTLSSCLDRPTTKSHRPTRTEFTRPLTYGPHSLTLGRGACVLALLLTGHCTGCRSHAIESHRFAPGHPHPA